jgi:2-amino-4-hydroxy-6-hydroxymethyldihydropteridine diphosphokinase
MPNNDRSLIKAYIGLGANLGDPIQQIIDAREALNSLRGSRKGRCSSLYLSSPVGYSEQPSFINCVLELESSLGAHGLFDCMRDIENSLGRVRDAKNQNAARLIDLDLLLFGDQVISDEILSVPHPRIAERLFVLRPLAELGPKITHSNSVDFTQQVLHKLVC